MNWYAIYTKPRNEKKVVANIQSLGIEAYCPTISVVKQWSDRKKTIIQPLLSSYVFVKLDEKDRSLVFQVPGVVRYLFWLGKPAIVREQEIQAMKELQEEKYYKKKSDTKRQILKNAMYKNSKNTEKVLK